MADLTVAAGYDRVMTWHPHCGQLRGFYGGLPVHFLDPLPYFQQAFAAFAGRDDSIVVAPDPGAAKLAIRVADSLGLRFAVGAKHRPARDIVEMGEIAGDFRRIHTALVVEDELGTGGTAAALVARLFDKIGVREIRLAVSHNRCLDSAEDRLRSLNQNQGLVELVVTDSIPQTRAFRDLEFLSVHSLADALSVAITSIHVGTGSY
jgi:ribose-phosphate pyrophosphokinase